MRVTKKTDMQVKLGLWFLCYCWGVFPDCVTRNSWTCRVILQSSSAGKHVHHHKKKKNVLLKACENVMLTPNMGD